MDKNAIKEKITESLLTLIEKDKKLFINNVNERSITHKLAVYLESHFTNYDVDCEYNKNLGTDKVVKPWESKRTRLIEELNTDAPENKIRIINKILDGNLSVYPDVIIHKRDTTDNLVVIEAKKDNYSGEDDDEEKLRAYKNDLNYKFAFKISFPIKTIREYNTKENIKILIKEIDE